MFVSLLRSRVALTAPAYRSAAVRGGAVAAWRRCSSTRWLSHRQFGGMGGKSSSASIPGKSRFGHPTSETHPHLLRPGEVSPGIHRSEYEARRRLLLSTMPPNSVMIVCAQQTLYMAHDIPYTFRQDSDFFWLTGFSEPDAVVVLVRGAGSSSSTAEGFGRTLLFVNPRDSQHELWWGPRTGPERCQDILGVDEAHSLKTLGSVLSKILQGGTVTAHALKNQQAAVEKLLVGSGVSTSLETAQGRRWLDDLRVIKSPAEIELMRKSGEVAGSAFQKLCAELPGLKTENEAAALFEYHCRRGGAQRLSYPAVMAGGYNALVLHYIQNDHALRHGEALLIDAGCEYNMYASDISRTYPVGGKFDDLQRFVYDRLAQAQMELIKMCRPGEDYRNIQFTSQLYASAILVGLRLLSGSVEDNLMNGSFWRFYPHSVGHFLGIDVHDCESVMAQSAKGPLILQPGMVLTIEPGLYFPMDEDIPPALRGLGIRIEDDILITPTGHEVLTKGAPKTLEEIEKAFATPTLS